MEIFQTQQSDNSEQIRPTLDVVGSMPEDLDIDIATTDYSVGGFVAAADLALSHGVDPHTPAVRALVDEGITLVKQAQSHLADLKRTIDPRSISKQYDHVGREDTTKQVAFNRQLKDQFTAEQQSIAGKLPDSEIEAERAATRQKHAEEELEARRSSTLTNVLSFLKIPDKRLKQLQADTEVAKQIAEDTLTTFLSLEKRERTLQDELLQIPDSMELLTAYYEQMKDRPMTQAEKHQLLKPEALTELTTSEYIQLWRRLNPHFVSHVTRQGFRDHNAMVYHSSGLAEYHNGFIGIMKDEAYIRPPLALGELKSRDEESVRRWMGDWVFEGDEQQALERMNTLMNVHLASAPKYPDKTAVHFMAETVGDDYYGAETGNEVFFIFPTDVIVSQHNFALNGWEKDLTRPQSEKKWNDVFVWPQRLENPGVQIDSGFSFFPKSTLVDPETGSKYASKIIIGEDGKEVRTLIEDTNIITTYRNFFREIKGNPNNTIALAYHEYSAEENYFSRIDLETSLVQQIQNDIALLGIPSDTTHDLALSAMRHLRYPETEVSDEEIATDVRASNAHYLRAQNPVPAKDYWERLFAQSPSLKPRHVIFYDGNPTQAVDSFMRDNGIGQASTAMEQGKLLGFDDNHVDDMANDDRSNPGKTELEDVARTIIKNHYESKK